MAKEKLAKACAGGWPSSLLHVFLRRSVSLGTRERESGRDFGAFWACFWGSFGAMWGRFGAIWAGLGGFGAGFGGILWAFGEHCQGEQCQSVCAGLAIFPYSYRNSRDSGFSGGFAGGGGGGGGGRR